jgi:hypothetical protein
MNYGTGMTVLPVTGVGALAAPGLLRVVFIALAAIIVGILLVRMASTRQRAAFTALGPRAWTQPVIGHRSRHRRVSR